MSTPDEVDDLEFRITKEDWNVYEFKDGTKLKARIFLTRLVEKKNPMIPNNLKPNESFGQYSISVQNNLQIFAPPHKKGVPTLPLPPVEKITEQQKEETEILTSNEPWNVYEIIKNGMIIRMKLVVSEVYRVRDTFDQFGEPYYVVKNSPIFDYKPANRKEKFA